MTIPSFRLLQAVVAVIFVSATIPCNAFSSTLPSLVIKPSSSQLSAQGPLVSTEDVNNQERRAFLTNSSGGLLSIIATTTVAVTSAAPQTAEATVASAQDQSDKYAPKFVQQYEDFTASEDGKYQYKDVKIGSGDVVIEPGDRVVYDWSGYTIGYFGRPFEAKGGPQGGAFDKDLDYSRTIIGSGTVVPAVEGALSTMKPGGVRQVVVPYGGMSYPADDLEHVRVGPKPTTFSGQRALNFVLENPRVDRTLLFNLKVVRVDKANGKGGFTRG